jgi:hypothetical protein
MVDGGAAGQGACGTSSAPLRPSKTVTDDSTIDSNAAMSRKQASGSMK